MKPPVACPLICLILAVIVAGCGSSTGNLPAPVASARFAFVANNAANSVTLFKVDQTSGLLIKNGFDSPSGCVAPSYIEPHPTMKNILFLSCQGSNNIVTFSVNRPSGHLAVVGTVTTGTGPHVIALDPMGKFLYVANTGANTVSAFSVGADGTLNEIAGSPFGTGTTPYTVKVADSGAFVYVTNRDSNNVSAYSIDSGTGALTQIAGSPFAADLGPRFIELSGKFAFVPNRFANDVSVYTVDSSTGALTQIPGSPFPAGSDPRSAVADPSGHFLYVGNTVSNDISAYVINSGTGALTPVSGSPFPAGVLPLHLEMDGMGRILYASNTAASTVTVYTMDSGSGRLQLVQTITTGGQPFSLALVE